jgi:hypothetical protein
MTIPGPPAPQLPPAPRSPGECAGPDPFIGIPGLAGVCIDGNWIPTNVLAGTGTVRFQTSDGGFWSIQLDDGRIFAVTGLPPGFDVDGLRVTFSGKFLTAMVSVYGSILELQSIDVQP